MEKSKTAGWCHGFDPRNSLIHLFIMNSLKDYEFGGREVTPVNLLLLLSEMEGTYQHLKYMGFKEEMDIIDLMKKRFYKMHFQLKKQQRLINSEVE